MTELSKRAAAPVPADWTYAPAPESREIVALRERYGLFVGGEWVEPRSGEAFTTISPRDEEPLAEVAQAGPEDVDARRRRRARGVPAPGRGCPAPIARSTSSGSRASFRSARASSPCSSR